MDEIKYSTINPDESFNFHCKRCGECCRKVKDSIMLEPYDFYRLALHLNQTPSEVMDRYTDAAFLDWGFPVLVLKTTGTDDACIFLKDNSCSVQSAKPRTCRMYPLSAEPDVTSPGKFNYLVVSQKEQHFCGPEIKASKWMDDNFPPFEREMVKLDYLFILEFGRIVRKIDHKHEDEVNTLMLTFRYGLFDSALDFKEQFVRNMAALKFKLEELTRE